MEREQRELGPQQMVREELKALGQRIETASSDAEREELMDKSLELKKQLEALEKDSRE